MTIRRTDIENGECYTDYETEYFLARRLAKNSDTLPFPTLSPLSKDVIGEMLIDHSTDKKLQARSQIAIPVNLGNGRYAGLFIRMEEKVGENEDSLEYEYKAIWADPAGIDTMPKYVKEMLKDSPRISPENIFVSQSRYQPLEAVDLPESDEPDLESRDVEEPEKKQALVSDNNSAPFVVEILKKLSDGEIYLNLDESSNQLKLHKRKDDKPIKEMTEEESINTGNSFRKKHLSLDKKENAKKSTKDQEHQGFSARGSAGFSLMSGLKTVGMGILLFATRVTGDDRNPDPTRFPTAAPSSRPSNMPSFVPTYLPTISHAPTDSPSYFPTPAPSFRPSPFPTEFPTLAPSSYTNPQNVTTSSERSSEKIWPNEATSGLVGFGVGAIPQAGAIICARTPFLDGTLFATKEAALEYMGPISATMLAAAGHTLIGGAFGAGIAAAAAAIHNEVEKKSYPHHTKYDHSETKARDGQGWGREDERVREWAYLGFVAGGIATVTAMAAVAINRCMSNEHKKVHVNDVNDVEVTFYKGYPAGGGGKGGR
jgi:hypothetical protein